MFETEYKRLVEKLAPGEALVSDTLIKMKRLSQSKRPIRRMRGSVMLAVVLLLGVIGASAITLGSIKVLNWKGEDVTEEKLSDYNTLTEPTIGEEIAWHLYGLTPANQYWAINFDKNTWIYNAPKETIASLEEFERRITSSGGRFLIPRDIPEGYHFESAELSFRLTEKTIAEGFAFLEKEVMDEGVTVYKYLVPDSVKENIESYNIRFQKGEGHFLHIQCDFGQIKSDQYFYLHGEEAKAESVAVKGMQEGLYLQEGNDHTLYLRTVYRPNERIISWPNGEVPDRTSEMPFMICNSLKFTINSNTLDKSQLINVAQGLR